MNLLAILENYREEECPDLGTVRSGADLSTLTRDEIVHECLEVGLDVLALCRLGAVDSRREELAKLLHFALKQEKTKEMPQTAQGSKTPRQNPQAEGPEQKKRKTYDALLDKIERLERQVQEKALCDDSTEFERAKREAKEEAGKVETAAKLKPWEREIKLNFDPFQQEVRRLTKVNHKGELSTAVHTSSAHSAEEAFQQASLGSMPNLDNLVFLNSKEFVAGQIHNHVDEWRYILGDSADSTQILDWLENGVDINHFVTPFTGKFWGRTYNDDSPPPRYFNNANNCKHFQDFITQTLQERLRNGSIQCLGEVGRVDPPHIISPLTIEPSKPRMCINLMYLNNWIRDMPFSLDTLKDVPRVVNRDAYFTSLDDKSGFDNVRLSAASRKFVAFQWGGYYFCFNTLPFGFKLSSYIYQKLNLQPTSYIRRQFSIPMFLYIDDRLIEQARTIHFRNSQEGARLANYIVCEVLIRLGYCLNLDKSFFVPTQTPVFLGFIIDSVEGCFRITQQKLLKFAVLRDSLLSQSVISVLDLQRLAGRCISFMLAVPAAKLYTREMNFAISVGIRSNAKVKLSSPLRDELEFWKFLDNWNGKLTWKVERHLKLQISSDASLYKWGGIVYLPGGKVSCSDFWSDDMRILPIMVLEGYALLKVLQSVILDVRCHKVDAQVDNQALINAWNNEGCKSREMNSVVKLIFDFTLANEISLSLAYIESKFNEADEPSRTIKKSDATICVWVWNLIQSVYGGRNGHTCDLMALDSNCMKDRNGVLLKHYTPYQTPLSAGVNMFTQHIYSQENCYVFPPFALVLPVIRFITQNNLTCTIIIPVENIAPLWLPSVIDYVKDAFMIGCKGQCTVLKFPTKNGFVDDLYGLAQSVWAVRLSPHRGMRSDEFSFGKSLFLYGPSVSSHCNLLCIGDSILTFLLLRDNFVNPMVHIFAEGGALICQIQRHLQRLAMAHPPLIILVHAGVNNMSKTFLYRDEYEQITETLAELCNLELTLKSLVQSDQRINVILSSIIGTKDGFINARARIVNASMKSICEKNSWCYMDNGDILTSHLRDCVHLNILGEQLYSQKILQVCGVALKRHI